MPKRKTKTSKKTVGKPSVKVNRKQSQTKQINKKAPKRSKKTVVQSSSSFAKFKKWLASNQQLIALAGIIIGLNLILASGWYMLYRRTVLSFQVSPSVTSEIRKAAPTRIAIAGKNYFDLPVTQGVISEGIWEVSDSSVVHLETSAYPGQQGNIVMYGHNTKDIFKLLPTVSVGDTITLKTESKETHIYKVTEVMTVKPSHIEVVLPTDHEVLTVYTCTGWFDSLRFVVRAEPVAATS